MLYSKAWVWNILPMLTCCTPLVEQFLINLLAFSPSNSFLTLCDSILPDVKTCAPVKESGSVLFPMIIIV